MNFETFVICICMDAPVFLSFNFGLADVTGCKSSRLQKLQFLHPPFFDSILYVRTTHFTELFICSARIVVVNYYLFIIHVNSYCTVLPLDISVGIKNITIVREKYNFFLLQCDTILWELFTSAKRQCGHFPTSAKIIQKIILHLKFLLLRSVFS